MLLIHHKVKSFFGASLDKPGKAQKNLSSYGKAFRRYDRSHIVKISKNSSHYTRLWGLAHFVDSTDFDLDAFDEARSFGVCNNV